MTKRMSARIRAMYMMFRSMEGNRTRSDPVMLAPQ